MIIDLTHTITPEMPVYPGTIKPSITPTSTLLRDGYREALISLPSHTGTHMDAPSNILQEGCSLDVLPASQFCGRAIVLDVSNLPNHLITADFLKAQNGALLSVDFVLFYTGLEKKWGTDEYHSVFPVPDEEAAKYLVSCGLKGVGTDALSIDSLESRELKVHKILLGGGLVIIENLCLKKVIGRNDLMFFALPLKFKDADGAPVRAIAETREFPDKESEPE